MIATHVRISVTCGDTRYANLPHDDVGRLWWPLRRFAPHGTSRERDASPLLFRVMIIRATTAVLIIRVMMDRFRTEGMYPNNT